MATDTYEWHGYDVIVIGAGGAGLRAAIEASAQGVKTALVANRFYKKNFAGPRLFVRLAALEMHTLNTDDRIDFIKQKAGIGDCNITKCCTEVCPETSI